jgi:arylsulfatase A-like enzyme
VRLLDVMPTLLDLAHVPVPKTAQGSSLVPFIAGEGVVHPVISEFVSMWHAPDKSGMTLPKAWERTIRTGSWTYVQRVSPDERKEELYETPVDPGEQRDVSAEPANLDRIERFRALVRAHETTCERLADRLAGREPAPMSAETMRELEALGYVGDAK